MTNPSHDAQLWLEEIEGAKALEWVKSQNAVTLDKFEKAPSFAALESKFLEMLNAKDKIVTPSLRGDYVYNFWQDAEHVRGLIRRMPYADFTKGNKRWETVLDLDKLAKTENENWVYKSITYYEPAFERAIISLSRGGKDAVVAREFDLKEKKFVKDGFALPEAKSRVTWIDFNSIIVSTDFGEGSLSSAGYPLKSKVLKRGQKLADATPLTEAPKDYMSIAHFSDFEAGKREIFVMKAKDFYNDELHYLAPKNELIQIPIPLDTSPMTVFKGFLLFTNRSEIKQGENKFPAGSLLAINLDDVRAKKADAPYLSIFAPDGQSFLLDASATSNRLYISVMKNVSSEVLTTTGIRGTDMRKLDLPASGTTTLVSSASERDRIILTFQSFFQPTSLYLIDGSGDPQLMQSLPARFDASNLEVSQEWVKSKDGTKVPYFYLRRKDAKGPLPTVLYGYGGFEDARTPYYMQMLGDAWLNAGGAFVLANIRGGGEFGPAWHQSALKANRQRSFDDFIAVAEDLISKKITVAEKLAIQGGSNGGLLVGNVFVQRPELFKAVVCQVPLLDMLRYHKLLAGSSWVAEYGDPDNAEEAKFLLKYSPYHNLKKGKKYPKVLFMTSTKDDRVHPGHARKMAALMQSYGMPYYYYENIDGGHSAAANLKEYARRLAIEVSFLRDELFGPAPAAQ